MIKFDKLSNQVIGLCLDVHRELGPGLLESTYQQCLSYELSKSSVKFELEKELPVKYKDVVINCGYRIDLLIEKKLILELKCVEKLLPIHEAQILTYMKLSDIKIGLLINFNVMMLKNGIKRFVL